MINSIVFDVGQVLFGYDTNNVITKIIGETPHRDEYIKILFDHDIWLQLDRGTLSHEDCVKILSMQLEGCPIRTEDIRRFISEFPHHMELIEESRDLFLHFKNHYKVYILSNFQNEPFDLLSQLHPFINEADGMVVSAKVNMMKPEPSIYRHLLETFDIEASRSLFIDDRPENIAAAKVVGMNGIVYQDPIQLRNDLEQFNLILN
jgi:putative hydrolase of the HAD superfamily